MRRAAGRFTVLLLLLALARSTGADVFVLASGDRITGKRLRSGKRSFVVQTEFGRLTIPRARVEKIVKDDGTEEVINAQPSPEPVLQAAPRVPTARLVLIVVGKSFWHAWDPKQNPAVDPTLRLEVKLDGEPVATYLDVRPDPNDLPGATVNTFSFMTGEVEMEGAGSATLATPEVRPGRASLRIDLPLPGDAAPSRQLELAYQINEGSSEEPAWKTVVQSASAIELKPETPSFVLVRQDPGRVEFSRRRMKYLETFRLDISGG